MITLSPMPGLSTGMWSRHGRLAKLLWVGTTDQSCSFADCAKGIARAPFLKSTKVGSCYMLTPIRLASCMHNAYAGALPQTRPTFVFPTIHASEKPGLAAAPRRLHVDEGWPLQSHEDYLATTAESGLSPFCAAAMEGRPLQVAPPCLQGNTAYTVQKSCKLYRSAEQSFVRPLSGVQSLV